MTTHEVARWFDGLQNWLGDALNRNVVKSLSEVSAAFREIPDKPLKDFLKEIKSAIAGVAPLVEEIKAFRSGQGGAADHIIKKINSLKAADLKELMKAFALRPQTVAVNKRLLQEFIESSNGPAAASNGSSSSNSALSEEIEKGYRAPCKLKDSPSTQTIQDLRNQFESFRGFSKPVLEGVALRLGYHFTGGKDEIFNKLLQTLEGMKISQFKGELIESL